MTMNDHAERKSALDRMAESLATSVVDRFASVEKWKKAWQEAPTIPAYNVATNQPYKGYNAISLLLASSKRGYNDPRWMTYKQSQTAGYEVKKGEKSTTIGFFNVYPIDRDTYIPKGLYLSKEESAQLKSALSRHGVKTYGDLIRHPGVNKLLSDINIVVPFQARIEKLLKEMENGQAAQIVFKTYSVFNAVQIEGIPDLALPSVTDQFRNQTENIHELENILDNSGVCLDIRSSTDPAYRPESDTVSMPPPERFDGAYEYYAAFMHELSHATKHERRNNRDLSNYAREELVAEFASLLINNKVGLTMREEHFDNHAAYLKIWSRQVSDNPRELFNVIREAGKAAEYVLELAEKPDKELNPHRAEFNQKRNTPDFQEFKKIMVELARTGKVSPRDAAEKINAARSHGLSKEKKPNLNTTETVKTGLDR